MPKLPKKKTKVLAQKKVEGEIKAKVEAQYRPIPTWFKKLFKGRNKKERTISAWNWISSHIGDIPKFMAIIGLTVIVKGVIDTTESFAKQITFFIGVLRKPTAIGFISSYAAILGTFATYLGVVPARKEPLEEAVVEWLISFLIAWMIVEYGGQLLLSEKSTLKAVIGLFLGV